jgi:hypothetical protein
MRFSTRFAAVAASLLALTAVSCKSEPKQSYPTQPVAAHLTDMQANVLAQQYLDQHTVAAPRTLITELRQPDGWWLVYQTPFDSTAKPPVLSYLIQVHNDGTVRQFE